MRRSKQFKEFTVEGLLAAMVPGVNHQPGNIARAYGKTSRETRELLETAARAGLLLRIPRPRGCCYQVEAPAPDTSDRVAPPYPNIRFDQDLVDYERGMRNFADLCMMVRR
jgi:hypothetical protein